MAEKSYYNQAQPILVAVDCIIFAYDGESIQLLLFKREVAPFAQEWSLVGSFVDPNEAVDAAAQRILRKHTGLENIYMKPLPPFGHPTRDPGGRVIALPYFALIPMPKIDLKAHSMYHAQWFDLKKVPSLVLDHDEMIDAAMAQLRRKARYQPIGFELLPEKFTIPQLLQLYQEIYQKEIDPANFRKKMLSFDILDKLEEKDKSSSRRGAFLYKFNPKRYQKLEEKGIDFSPLV